MAYRLATILAGATLAASAASAGTPDISGDWNVVGRIAYGSAVLVATPTCSFQQAGGVLSGECVGPNARGPLTGLVAGNKVSWTWKHDATDAIGLTGESNFAGVYVNSHLIRGKMSSTATPAVGTFTQTR